MSRERKDSPGRATIWNRRRKAIRLADYWRKRWATHPESLKANLDRINKERKDRAREKTRRLAMLAEAMPPQIHSAQLRETIRIALQGHGMEGDRRQVERVRVGLIRRRLIAFDNVALTWKVALPPS